MQKINQSYGFTVQCTLIQQCPHVITEQHEKWYTSPKLSYIAKNCWIFKFEGNLESMSEMLSIRIWLMHVLAFAWTNLAGSQILWVDKGRAKIWLKQPHKKVKLGKAFFHTKLSEGNPKTWEYAYLKNRCKKNLQKRA